MDNLPSLGIGGSLFIALYLSSLLVLGFIAKRSLKENTLADFYLAGKGFGFGILFLTLFATQYDVAILFLDSLARHIETDLVGYFVYIL